MRRSPRSRRRAACSRSSPACAGCPNRGSPGEQGSRRARRGRRRGHDALRQAARVRRLRSRRLGAQGRARRLRPRVRGHRRPHHQPHPRLPALRRDHRHQPALHHDHAGTGPVLGHLHPDRGGGDRSRTGGDGRARLRQQRALRRRPVRRRLRRVRQRRRRIMVPVRDDIARRLPRADDAPAHGAVRHDDRSARRDRDGVPRAREPQPGRGDAHAVHARGVPRRALHLRAASPARLLPDQRRRRRDDPDHRRARARPPPAAGVRSRLRPGGRVRRLDVSAGGLLARADAEGREATCTRWPAPARATWTR